MYVNNYKYKHRYQSLLSCVHSLSPKEHSTAIRVYPPPRMPCTKTKEGRACGWVGVTFAAKRVLYCRAKSREAIEHGRRSVVSPVARKKKGHPLALAHPWKSPPPRFLCRSPSNVPHLTPPFLCIPSFLSDFRCNSAMGMPHIIADLYII